MELDLHIIKNRNISTRVNNLFIEGLQQLWLAGTEACRDG
jgi:hypothetical protein